ncbi:alpha/beta hydrolase fold protein [Corynebacterium humireducens NBRC 106098 = DSM 45392]|uniref:Alpha/beta hydrolase fold protein n=1 Tax=Corynebacterium humireducens NBRC 106098 = DSM 45392 TaxID=1223515 RepID=A0A0B5D577_9CORY|nr:alpha/beta fold hydrolase [Corynebacterium humireducens]AJE34175.1 alpha/beta hydrolase fold protein [Corynebacterium humireducens NBRC 106098 = DSM 45392]
MVRTRRRLLLTTVALLVVVLVAGVVLLRDGPEVGSWRSAEAQATYAENYELLIAELPVAPERLDVETPHGVVRALHWPGAGEPVLLIPGRSSGSAQWVENLPGWIGARPIYALDPLGDAGFSTQRVPLDSVGQQADAYVEVLDALGVDRVHVVGHSFGGAQAANLAVWHPDRVASVALMEPVLVIASPPVSLFFWATVASLPLPQSLRDRALAEIGGTTVEAVRSDSPMSRMIDAASRGYSAALPMPGPLTDEQWRTLDMPVRLDLGGRQSLSGGGAAERIRGLLPDATVTVWPDGTHSLPMDRAADFDGLLPDFWAAAEGTGDATP